MQIQDSWLLKKPTDLELHCLQNRVYLGSAGQGLTFYRPYLIMNGCHVSWPVSYYKWSSLNVTTATSGQEQYWTWPCNASMKNAPYRRMDKLILACPANTQRRNSVDTTSLQRHDVAATLLRRCDVRLPGWSSGGLVDFLLFFYKGDYFCDILFAFMHIRPHLKRGLL